MLELERLFQSPVSSRGKIEPNVDPNRHFESTSWINTHKTKSQSKSSLNIWHLSEFVRTICYSPVTHMNSDFGADANLNFSFSVPYEVEGTSNYQTTCLPWRCDTLSVLLQNWVHKILDPNSGSSLSSLWKSSKQDRRWTSSKRACLQLRTLLPATATLALVSACYRLSINNQQSTIELSLQT